MKLLDTDLLIDFLRGSSVAREFLRQHEGDVATTTITAGELFEGAAGSRSPVEDTTRIQEMLRMLPVIPYGPRHARRYGVLAHQRRKAGLPGGPTDVLIASIAVEEGMPIVTRNVRDFEGHQGLEISKW